MRTTERRVLVITGPTATGKTALGVALARQLNGEILSADSMQLYRGMDIGTAKVTAEEACGVPHHLIDVAEPWEPWSVSRWTEAAAEIAEDLLGRGKLPILVGGTGLYLDALLSGRDFAPAGADGAADTALRAELNAEYDRVGGEAFRAALGEVDPERAEKLHPADRKRLVRAMEVWRLTGETISAHDARTRARPPRWPSVRFALCYRERETLYRQIDRRVDAMAEAGLFGEVRRLLDAGLGPDCTAMQAIGYKELAACFRGECSREEALDAVRRESRRYAKRQLTWLRRDKALHWIFWERAPDIPAAVETVKRVWRENA